MRCISTDEDDASLTRILGTQQLFPGFQEFTKCFNIHDVQAISVIRPYLDQEVFKSTLASLSYGLASFYVGTEITTSKELLLHRGKAITLLRSHLDAGQAHSAVLLSILYMIMLEVSIHLYRHIEY